RGPRRRGRGRRRHAALKARGRSRPPWRRNSPPRTPGRDGRGPSRPVFIESPPNPRKDRSMADKSPDFPVGLEKDGVKRTAHTPIAYNQLKTEGFAEKKASPKSKAPAKTKSEK